MYHFHQLCDKHPDILTTDVWVTIGFTYRGGEYCLIKQEYEYGLCLGCTRELNPKINAFCYECKAPRPIDWTTGNKLLDSFIMESWSNTRNEYDAYLEWIPFDWVNLHGLPTRANVKLIPLEITDETHDLYYAEVNYLLMQCL